MEKKIILSIFILALSLRLWGIYPGYPDIHPDESSSYATAVHLLYNFFKPDRFDYPAGVPFINVLAYVLFFIPIAVLKIIFINADTFIQFIFSPHSFFIQYKEAIFGNRDFFAMYWTRAVTALFGAGTVLVLYVVGKKLFSKEVGLFAAFFLAVNYLHVIRSHFGLPDVYNGFFVTLSLYISVLILEKNTRNRYLFAGVVSGIAFALKYQVFSLLPFIIVHCIWTVRKKNIWYFFHKNAFYAAFAFIATFLIINPYYISNIEDAMRMNRQDILRYRMGEIFLRPYGYFYLYHWGIDRLPSIMVLVGIVVMLLKSSFRFIIVAPFAFVFMFFMTVYSQGGAFPRNFATVIPYLMLFAGYGMYIIFSFFKKISPSFAIVITVILLFWINYSSLKNSLILDQSYSQPWNVTKLAQWINDVLPKKTKLRHYQAFFPQLARDALAEKQIVLRDWSYDRGPNSLAEFQEEETDFALLNTSTLQSITYWWRGWLDPKLYLKYDTVPFDFIENDFYGLTIKELSNYTVFEAYKPWQAHHDNNYLVYKIPKKPLDLGKKIAGFSFDIQEDAWEVKGTFEGESPIRVFWSSDEGYNNKGAIIATSSGVRSRIASKAIPVKPGKLYSATGFIKTFRLVEGERDGFLRIDFYKDKKESTIKQIGIDVAISKRASASGEWEEVQVSMKAPKDAGFMTVSFQFKDAYFTSVLDDIKIYESEKIPEEPFKEVPIITPTIPIESIYYNSFI